MNTTTTTTYNNHKKKEDDNDPLAFCVVWSPLPPITWLIPVIGHLGICNSQGVASDFRGPYFVGDDGQMAFGAPTRAVYFGPSTITSTNSEALEEGDSSSTAHEHEAMMTMTTNDHANNYARLWDRSIQEANEVYRGRMHNICCDNCHSHVANALNRMNAKLASTTTTTTTTTATPLTTSSSPSTATIWMMNNHKKKNKKNGSCPHHGLTSASVTLTSHWDMVKLAFLVFFQGRFLSWYAIYAQFGPFLVLFLIVVLCKILTTTK
ncbi:hypothetical protein ACA910_011790 [Epithemia clementina (nom. ined.)]